MMNPSVCHSTAGRRRALLSRFEHPFFALFADKMRTFLRSAVFLFSVALQIYAGVAFNCNLAVVKGSLMVQLDKRFQINVQPPRLLSFSMHPSHHTFCRVRANNAAPILKSKVNRSAYLSSVFSGSIDNAIVSAGGVIGGGRSGWWSRDNLGGGEVSLICTTVIQSKESKS
jgi:hypothetical protein